MWPSVDTRLGPAFDPLELGANKILVVYNNPTRGRDADDIARLCATHTFARLLKVADMKEVEPINRNMLSDMFNHLSIVDDPTFDPSAVVRDFMRAIATHLRSGTPLPPSPYGVTP